MQLIVKYEHLHLVTDNKCEKEDAKEIFPCLTVTKFVMSPPLPPARDENYEVSWWKQKHNKLDLILSCELTNIATVFTIKTKKWQ